MGEISSNQFEHQNFPFTKNVTLLLVITKLWKRELEVKFQ